MEKIKSLDEYHRLKALWLEIRAMLQTVVPEHYPIDSSTPAITRFTDELKRYEREEL